MSWQLLAAMALPTIASIGMQYAFGKPKQENFEYDTSYVDKYISSIRGRAQEQQIYQQTMKPLLRTIGRQGEAMRKQGQYAARRGGYAGTGVEAQMTLSREQQQLGAYTQAGEKALAAQAQETRNISQQVAKAEAEREQNIQKGRKGYGQAVEQWKQGMIQTGVQGLTSMAVAGIQQKVAAADAAKKGVEVAKTSWQDALKAGIINAAVTFPKYQQNMTDLNITDPKVYNTQLGIQNAPEDTPAQLTEWHDKHRAAGGQYDAFDDWNTKRKQLGYRGGENFNAWLVTTVGEAPDPFKAKEKDITTLNALQRDGHSDVEILKAAKLIYRDKLRNVKDVDAMMNTEGVDIDLVHSRLTRKREDIAAKDKGKNIAITFNAQLENIESQVPDLETKGPLEVPRTEVVKILDSARRTGFVTADQKATLHKYALQLSNSLPKDQTWFITSDFGETTEMTSDQIYQRLSKDIDAFIIKESTKTLPGI